MALWLFDLPRPNTSAAMHGGAFSELAAIKNILTFAWDVAARECRPAYPHHEIVAMPSSVVVKVTEETVEEEEEDDLFG